MSKMFPSQAQVNNPRITPTGIQLTGSHQAANPHQPTTELPHAQPNRTVAKSKGSGPRSRTVPVSTRARRKQWQDGIWDVAEWDTLIAKFPPEMREYFRAWEEQDGREREEEFGGEAVEARRNVGEEEEGGGRYVRWEGHRESEDGKVGESGRVLRD